MTDTNSKINVALIGCSAGGLAPMQALVESLSELRAAILVIQHHAPEQETLLGSLMSAWTAKPVTLLVDGMPLGTDQIYVVPPGQVARIEADRFQLESLASAADVDRFHQIDATAIALAQSPTLRLMLVLLSGAGNDGTRGAEAIRRSGGTVAAQDPEEAEFPEMPRSAIQAKQVHVVLPATKMGTALTAWAQGAEPPKAPVAVEANRLDMDDTSFQEILALILHHAHQDKSEYKQATLKRRINRRMGLLQVDRVDQYLALLRQQPDEIAQLAHDMLIGVTAFFRDPEAFAILAANVVPTICAAKGETDPVRVWIAGCSTGEEAYSVAILLHEWFAQAGIPPRIQMFATDIDERALQVARTGLYSEDVLEGVSAERLGRHFEPARGGFSIAKQVRESIVFASHDLIADPPFSRLDLIVCRNVLIYLNPEIQKRLLGLFHFVLNQHGYLFLGSSESVGVLAPSFQPISKAWRIFEHTVAADKSAAPPLPIAGSAALRWMGAESGSAKSALPFGNFEGAYRLILERSGPTQILVNARHEVLYVLGSTAAYLQVPAGEVSSNLVKLALPHVAGAIRVALNRAQTQRASVEVSTRSHAFSGTASAASRSPRSVLVNRRTCCWSS